MAVVLSFIDCINRGDIAGLERTMTVDHVLQVFDEPPLTGRADNINAWDGYVKSFPRYVIYPHRLAARDDQVAVLGHTTGSHLGLPDLEESALTLIWIAKVEAGKVRLWRPIEDTTENRADSGLDLV
jgi:hypothetical protein